MVNGEILSRAFEVEHSEDIRVVAVTECSFRYCSYFLHSRAAEKFIQRDPRVLPYLDFDNLILRPPSSS